MGYIQCQRSTASKKNKLISRCIVFVNKYQVWNKTTRSTLRYLTTLLTPHLSPAGPLSLPSFISYSVCPLELNFKKYILNIYLFYPNTKKKKYIYTLLCLFLSCSIIQGIWLVDSRAPVAWVTSSLTNTLFELFSEVGMQLKPSFPSAHGNREDSIAQIVYQFFRHPRKSHLS